MIVTYQPEGGDRQRWTFDARKVRASQAEAIEGRAGESWDQWLISVQKGGMRARRVMLWHLLTLDHPALRWEDTPDFYAGELLLEYSVTELGDMRERLAQANLPADQRAMALAALDLAIDDATAKGNQAEGKAP